MCSTSPSANAIDTGDAKQNRHIAGGRDGNCHCGNADFSTILYSFECREREGMQTGMLRKQNMLQNVRQEYCRSLAAACQS